METANMKCRIWLPYGKKAKLASYFGVSSETLNVGKMTFMRRYVKRQKRIMAGRKYLFHANMQVSMIRKKKKQNSLGRA